MVLQRIKETKSKKKKKGTSRRAVRREKGLPLHPSLKELGLERRTNPWTSLRHVQSATISRRKTKVLWTEANHCATSEDVVKPLKGFFFWYKVGQINYREVCSCRAVVRVASRVVIRETGIRG